MKNRLVLIAALTTMAANSNTFAQQNSRIVTTTTTEQHDPSYSLGRDFWFAPAQNYVDEQGKYIQVIITSPNNTTAYVEFGGITASVPVQSDGIGTFNVPLTYEMKSSGNVENKAIHVYDNTDDIEVYLMSHNQYSADGMYCIPTIGWGNDYVVAGFSSLFDGNYSSSNDFPSEFTISADQDNTIVEVTPSCDLRMSNSYPENDSAAAFPKGQKFSLTLNRGQSVQYQSVLPLNGGNYDVTGTVIHSSNPVGVVGASMCANIPQGFAYCNYVTDMISPVRTWGKTYYTTNSVHPVGEPNKNENLYLMISTLPNQTIYRYSPTEGLITEAVLDSTFDHLYAEEQGPNKWSSDHPFLLVQYLNSSSYPDDVNGNGNPAEVVISPLEDHGGTILLATPANAQDKYDNYANIIVNVNDIDNVKFDGKPITSYTHEAIDGIYTVYIIPHIEAAAHTVTSDSAAMVYIYGYGENDSYAWGSSYGIANPNSTDNTPPVATITSDCFDATVQLSDFAAGLSEIVLDSVVNMSYRLDSNWIDGAGLDTSGYSMFVIDNTKSAVLEISVFDGAGNRTTVKSSYIPQTANIDPALQNFGASTTSSPAVVRYDTLVNAGQVPFKLGQLSLKYGNQGFVIDSADIQDAIPVGGKRLIKISFNPVVLTLAVDSLIYGDQCFTQTSALLGSGSAMDFFVEDAVWQNVPLNPVPPGWTKEGAVIHNLSKTSSIHVSSAGWVDNVHFALVPGQTFPVTVPPLDTASVFYYFEPTNFTRDTSAASWSAPEVTNSNGSLVIRYNKLIGNAVAPLLTFTGDTTVNLNCLDTSVHSVLLTFYISNNGSEPAVINRVTVVGGIGPSNITGVDQHGNTWNPVANQETIPAGAVDMIEVTFPIDPQSNSSFTSQITALDASDNIIGAPLTATVNVNYSVASVSATNITFGPVSYWGTKVPGVFIIWNTGSTALTIDTMFFIEGGPYNSSFSFTTTPILPDILPAGQTMSVNVAFDPSVSSDSEQNSVLEIFSDACNEMAVNLGASLLVSGVAESNAPSTLATIVMLDNGRSIQFNIPSDWTPSTRIDIYNILGETVYSSSLDGTSTLDLGELPHGVYFYRLHTEQTTQTGEIIIGE